MRKILVWGTGKISTELCENGFNGSLIGFIETKKQSNIFRNMPVYDIDESWPDFDYVIVANAFPNEIYIECIKRNINIDKFIFLYPVFKKVGKIELDVLKDILEIKNYTFYCMQNGYYTNTFFYEDLKEYQRKNIRNNFKIDENKLWPVISDKYSKAGTIGNYFWQDLWAAKLIHKSGIKKHFDIGSRIDGFIAHLLAMDIDVTLIDIRQFPVEVSGLHTIVDNATELGQVTNESIESMSALCSIEHFGLGRYGDPIDPEACFKCFSEIQRKIKPGGSLYISLPIGNERVEFNAHRVFFASTVIECFRMMNLIEFSCAAEGKIEYNVDIKKYDNDRHNGEYRYGLFHFEKV